MKKQVKKIITITTSIIMAITIQSCDDFEKFEPLDSNSIADQTPPQADFSYSQGEGTAGDEWMSYSFGNLSSSATTYSWDLGNGTTSTDFEPTTIYPGEGMYTVTLTASDNLGVSSTFSETIEVIEPEVPSAIVPTINEAGFEDGSDACGTAADGRDCWRNSDLGGVIQITSSPVQEGSQAAKFPSAGDRVGYQELTVSPNSEYTLSYSYTLKTNNPGSITVSVLAGGGHTDLTAALAATIEDFEGTDQTSASDYVGGSVTFNTGANSTISILITNQGEEARVDNFSIIAN
ncbi:PKD domain-containing protein [Olleya sp. YSTF-M6]|uniref:PKD domain-containing protein n=1 Tax=Olleya sediminilitoris TaxID=2795739 RepID=A0ABS1WNZ2_9FLAO|nr:PKD domain-containing protein [Olleya sediminilitoris]MBL7560847.1 PKD domain-containing protein [Olleya sediminilitoris]